MSREPEDQGSGGGAGEMRGGGEDSQPPEENQAIDVADLKKRADERDLYRSELLRARADFENLQKRTRKERLGWEDQAVRRFVRDLLPVVDNFERALASVAAEGPQGPLEEGIRMTHQLLRRLLEDNSVSEVPAQGEMFNPEVHEAVAEEPVEDRPTGEIVEVLQKGYRHGDSLLRPSRVKVARNAKEEESTSHADL